jgi:hypothetical protein
MTLIQTTTHVQGDAMCLISLGKAKSLLLNIARFSLPWHRYCNTGMQACLRKQHIYMTMPHTLKTGVEARYKFVKQFVWWSNGHTYRVNPYLQ